MTKAFNPQQVEAVRHMDGPCCVIAGAGSGKTAVLTGRIQHLLEQGIPGASILAVTFSKKAAAEMRERLNAEIGTSEVNIRTFHSLGYMILASEQNGFVVGKTPIKEYQRIDFIEKSIAGTVLDIANAAPKQISTWIGLQKGRLHSWQDKPDDVSEDLDALYNVYKRYEEYKHDNKLYDFDDMTDVPVFRLLANENLKQYYLNRFRYILVDEYQDTGYAQAVLLKLLGGAAGNVFAVGDDSQSIYSFRGAQVRNILDFQKHFLGAKMIYLDVNYRSTPEIVALSNTLIGCNINQLPKRIRAEKSSIKLIPSFTQYETEEAEANGIVRRIELLAHGGAKLSDMAILYRINSKIRVFEEALQKKGIAFRVQDGRCFFQEQYVSDLIDYLKLALNPHDSDALLRVLNRPNRYFGKIFRKHLEAYMRQKKVSALQALSEMPEAVQWKYRRSVETLCDHLSWLNANSKASPSKLLSFIYETIGYKEFLATDASDDLFAERMDSIDELMTLANSFNSTVALVLYAAMQVDAYQHFCENPDAVTLSTVHKVKGLEFPVVFLVSCIDGMFPHRDATDVEEERRIMYVAVTRASERLELSATAIYRDNPATVSPFIGEVIDHLQVQNMVTQRAGRLC